jgi:hypothetical protein
MQLGALVERAALHHFARARVAPLREVADAYLAVSAGGVRVPREFRFAPEIVDFCARDSAVAF